MRRIPNVLKGLVAVCALALLAGSGRADDVPKFKKKGDQEKKFVSEVCVAVLKAAHPTGVDPSLDRYEFKEEKPGRTMLTIKGTYKGKVTRKVYNADIGILIDSSNKDAWEVLRIDYSDNNNIAPGRARIDALRKKFNE
jgi:hypothetical protein